MVKKIYQTVNFLALLPFCWIHPIHGMVNLVIFHFQNSSVNITQKYIYIYMQNFEFWGAHNIMYAHVQVYEKHSNLHSGWLRNAVNTMFPFSFFM